MNIYEWADNAINSCPRYATGFTELLAIKPYCMSPTVRRHYDLKLLTIRSFQKVALEIFRAALDGEMDPAILHWLMNETPDSLGLRYHRSLEDRRSLRFGVREEAEHWAEVGGARSRKLEAIVERLGERALVG